MKRLLFPTTCITLCAACLIAGPPKDDLAPILPDTSWSDDQGGTVSFHSDGSGEATGGYFLSKVQSFFGCEDATGYAFTWEVDPKSEDSNWENIQISLSQTQSEDAGCSGLGGSWGMGIVEVSATSFALGVPILSDEPDATFTLD